MQRLSCGPRYMWFKKKAAPIIFALMMLAIVATVLWHIPSSGARRNDSLVETVVMLMFVVVPLAMAGWAIAFFLFKANSFMDEVSLDGDTLVLRNQGKMTRVSLVDVLDASVKPSIYDDYDRTVVLKLRNSQFGKTVIFSTPRRGYLPSKSTQELIQRVKAGHSTAS